MGFSNKAIFVLLGVLLLGSGLAMAIRGATTTKVLDLARWTAVGTAESEVTEGGNITIVNLDVGSLTERWAGYFGNLTGALYLTDNVSGTTRYLFRWTGANATNDGEVCASQNTAFNFLAAVAGKESTGEVAAMDAAGTWNFGSAPDNAVNTFSAETCGLVFDEQLVTITNASLIDHTNSTFNTCLVTDGANASRTDFAFCVQTQASGTAYNGNPANYELMVPTRVNTAETYYFYAEIN